MGKVVYDVSMSLDGFITGANPRVGEGLGDDGERLHAWAFDSDAPRNKAIVADWVNTGAIIAGRNTYDLSIQYWSDGGPSPANRLATIIVSHSVPDDVPPNSVYIFASGIEQALEEAQAAAGDKPVGILGAGVARQLIQLGRVDEVVVHIIPALFGEGVRLFEETNSAHITLEPLEVIETKEALHTRNRVVN